MNRRIPWAVLFSITLLAGCVQRVEDEGKVIFTAAPWVPLALAGSAIGLVVLGFVVSKIPRFGLNAGGLFLVLGLLIGGLGIFWAIYDRVTVEEKRFQSRSLLGGRSCNIHLGDVKAVEVVPRTEGESPLDHPERLIFLYKNGRRVELGVVAGTPFAVAWPELRHKAQGLGVPVRQVMPEPEPPPEAAPAKAEPEAPAADKTP